MHYVVAKPSEAIPPNTNTTHITHKYQPNVTQIHKYHFKKVLIHNPNWPKVIEKCPNGQKWQKNAQKMAQNGPKQPKRSEFFRQLVQMRQGIPTPN